MLFPSWKMPVEVAGTTPRRASDFLDGDGQISKLGVGCNNRHYWTSSGHEKLCESVHFGLAKRSAYGDGRKFQAETGRDDLMDILPLAAFLKRNSNP